MIYQIFQAVSKWTEKNFDSDGLVTATLGQILAQLIRVILQTGMFISGILGFVLDNTVPGKFQ